MANHSYAVPTLRFTAQPWSLEPRDVDDLMAKIRRAGVPLREFITGSPLYGIKTGLNEAFLIDTPTKERLQSEDPRSAEILSPYLRGQDMKRWSPDWQGLWFILLKSSGNQTWPWSNEAEDAEDTFARTFPAIHRFMKPMEAKLHKRQDQGHFWWELRSCDYYDRFQQPKFVIQRIAFHSRIGLDRDGMFVNDSAIMMPTTDAWLLACLNSPANWYFAFRYMPHKKDEALAMDIAYVETLPIPQPTDAQRTEAESTVARLIALTQKRRMATRELLEWLRVEFAVESPGQRLAAFATLDDATFVDEVRRRRTRAAGRLSPAALRDLRDTFTRSGPPLRALAAEAQQHERRVAELVNVAYGLTPADVDLLWRTAPPRMPVGQ